MELSSPRTTATTATIDDKPQPPRQTMGSFRSMQTHNHADVSKKQINEKVRRLSEDSFVELSPGQWKIGALLYSMPAEWLSGLVTLVNFVLILRETDITASDASIPAWLLAAGAFCLAYFFIELMMRFYVERLLALQDGWNMLDVVIVFSGIVGLGFDLRGERSKLLGPVRCLRCLRLVRILKAFSLSKDAKHLRSMVRSMSACLKLLVWTFPIVFLVLTVWATFAVQLLHPLMGDVARRSRSWDGCDRCARSFESVMAANLTLFQTIIAGDSWGLVAVPVIESYPWSSVIFVGSIFTIATGVLNLIVAILVDAAADARASDIEMRALESRQTEITEKATLKKMFNKLDSDGNGGLSFDELLEGKERISELGQMLETMDIQGEELHQLFLMLDEDGSGEVDADEFIDTLYRLKCGDNKTAAIFVKRYVLHMQDNMKKNQTILREHMHELHSIVKTLQRAAGACMTSSVADFFASAADAPSEVSNLDYNRRDADLCGAVVELGQGNDLSTEQVDALVMNSPVLPWHGYAPMVSPNVASAKKMHIEAQEISHSHNDLRGVGQHVSSWFPIDADPAPDRCREAGTEEFSHRSGNVGRVEACNAGNAHVLPMLERRVVESDNPMFHSAVPSRRIHV